MKKSRRHTSSLTKTLKGEGFKREIGKKVVQISLWKENPWGTKWPSKVSLKPSTDNVRDFSDLMGGGTMTRKAEGRRRHEDTRKNKTVLT